MGILWMILDPLLILGVYLFVFGFIFQGKFKGDETESRLEYGITVFLGLAMFRVFSEILGTTSMSVLGNRNYVKKIVFPLEILPILDIIAALYSFFITLLLVIAGQCFFGEGLSAEVIWLPIILLELVLLMVGVGWIFSSITVYFLDLSHIIPFLTISTLFSSAIFYPIDKIPPAFWNFLKYNPILQLIESARCVVMWGKEPSVEPMIWIMMFSIGIFYFGYFFFKGLRNGFADVL